MENKLNKRHFVSKYSIDEIKEKNKYFFLCQTIDDVLKQIELLAKENKSSFILDRNKIILTIPTNMNLAPEIKIELKEESKSLESRINDINDYIVKTEKQNENNMDLLIKENKEMKDLINILIKENKEIKEEVKTIKQYLFDFSSWQGYYKLDEKYFDRIRDWIGGDKKNIINFELIFNINSNLSDKAASYDSNCNINAPAIFIFITSKKSIFGAYCPNYHTSNNVWVSNSNAFLFSLNLNKKYPAINAKENYYTGTCGFHFKDIEFCSGNFIDRKGSFSTGTYINNLELEGNDSSFIVEQFLVYRVIKQ